MHGLLIKKSGWHAAALCCFLCCLLCGCGMFGKSCEQLDTELHALYDGYLDDSTKLSEAEILARCEAAISQCPGMAVAFELAGLVHWENDRMAKALEYYTKALALSPGNEELLTDAMIVAFEARRNLLYIGDDGKVKTQSFAKLSLKQYTGIPDDVRLLWCEYALDRSTKPGTESTEIRNRQGKAIGKTSVEFSSSLKTPRDLDYALLNLAKTQPEEGLSEATADLLMKYTSSEVTTEIY